MSECIDLVRVSIPDLTQKELDEVLDQMRGRQATLIRSGMDPSTAAAQAGMIVSEQLKAAAAIQRRNELRNRRIRLEALDYLQTTWQDKPWEGMLSIVYGSAHARQGSRSSVGAAQQALRHRYLGGFGGDLQAVGLFDVFARGEMDKDVFFAMRSIGDDVELKKLPQQAVQIAQILHKWQEVARLDANRAGAWIGKLDDHGLRQTHNPDRLWRAGQEKWKADIAAKLDIDRMFPNGPPDDMDAWLSEAFTNITTGVRDPVPDPVNMAAFKGPGNLAKSLSHDRVLHFKTAEDAFQYNIDYGMGSVRETYVSSLQSMAESTGLMQVLGTNPEYNLRAIMDSVRARLSRSDVELLKKFDNKTSGGERITNAYLEVSGFTRRAASTRLATVGAFVRVWNTVVGLGGAVASAVTDVPTRASLLRYHGDSYLKGISTGVIAPLTRLADSLDSPEKKAVLSACGYYNEVAMGNLITRFSSDDTLPGALSSATNIYFKLNLLAQWTDSMRRATIEALSSFWGSLTSKSWGDLSERNHRALERFNITEREWAVMKDGIAEADGRKFWTPQAIREMPPDKFSELAADRINEVKAGLAERVQKRMKQDEREQKWVSDRAQKLQDALAVANEKLKARLDKADDRAAMRLRDIQVRLAALYGRVDASNQYWRNVRKRLPSVSQTVASAVQAERAEKRIATIERAQRQAVQDLLEFKASKEVAFDAKWDARMERLAKSLKRSGDEAEANARLGQFDDAFAEANAAITESLKAADKKTAAKMAKLSDRLQNSQKALTESLAEIEKSKTAAPAAGELRSQGTVEGRALEAAKEIRSEARLLSLDLERFKKETNENFIEMWTERNDEMVAFADGIAQRVKERAERNATEFGDLDSRIERILTETRDDMADRLQRVFADDLDSAVISPDARTNAFVRQGKRAGTAMGEALRLFWQFKSFGIAYMQRAFMRELYGYGPKFGISAARGLATLLVGGLSFGYAAMTIKDMLKGKKPRPLDRPSTWAAAMVQGGGLGIYGDFFLGETSRMGGGVFETLGGPTVGKLGDVKRLYDAAKRGEDVGAQALRIGVNNVPGNNLFYTRMAVDYLFLYEMQEAMNPGYLRRMERRAEEERGQEWWLRPSEVVD